MIEYETNSSPFFIANKAYCEQIESRLKDFGYDYSGFCNSYGYSIETKFNKKNIAYNLKYFKHQTTRNGVIIPMDANDYSGVELHIKGFERNSWLKFGKNKLKRLFTKKQLRDTLPIPYFISTNIPLNKISNSSLVKTLLENKVDSFRLKNGKTKLKISFSNTDMFNLIDNIEKEIKILS